MTKMGDMRHLAMRVDPKNNIDTTQLISYSEAIKAIDSEEFNERYRMMQCEEHRFRMDRDNGCDCHSCTSADITLCEN